MNFGLKGTLAKCLSALLICTMGSMTTAYAEPISLKSNSSGNNSNVESFISSKWKDISKDQLLSSNNNSIFGLAGNFNAFVKNDFYMNGADEEGRLAAGGNVTLNGNGVGAELSMTDEATKSASLIVGGNYTGKNTAIANGFAIVNGKVDSADYNVLKYNKFYSYPDLINFNEQFQKLTGLSNNIDNAAKGNIGSNVTIQDPANTSITITGTIGKVTKSAGKVEFKGNNPIYNIFNVNAKEYINADGINDLNFDVPSGSAIIVNVIGKTVNFPKCGITMDGQGVNGHSLSDVGGNPDRIMWNMANTENISSRGSVEGSVLAPNADWKQPDQGTAHGDLEGNMIVKSFYSSTGFELHDFFFTGEVNGKIRVVKTSTWNDTRIFHGVIFSLYKEEANGSWNLIDKRGFSQAGDMNFINLSKGTYKLVEDKTDSSNKLLKHPIIITLPLKSKDSIPLAPNTSNNMIKSATNVLGNNKDGYMGTNLNIYNDSIYVPDKVYNTGTLIITKVNTSNKPLAGAVFNLYDSNNNLLGTYTTNKSGKITINNIFVGKYYLKEVKAPVGYAIKQNPVNLNIAKGHILNVTIVDKAQVVQTGRVVITKTGENNTPLAGSTIGIYNSDNKLVYSGVTDSKGEVSTNLPYGKYTYKEIKAPVGYTLSTKVGTLDITTNGSTVTGSINDVKITGKVVITKTDETGKVLAGATIGIYNSDNKLVYSGVTDSKGEVSTNLPFGKYTYKELKAPEGYDINTEIGHFAITTNNELINNLVIKDSKKPIVIKKGNLQIIKQDKNTGKALEGAKFEITNTKTGEKYTEVTDANGKINLDSIPYGEYIIKEVLAPTGYTLSQETNIEIDSATVKTVVIKDAKIEGTLTITKLNENKQALSGATFNILDQNGNFIKSVTTGKDGVVTVPLSYGNYKLVEVKAPIGYELNSNQISFTIDKNGQVIQEKVIDTSIARKVIITKTDVDGKGLAGAVIQIKNAEGKVIFTGTTDKSGQVTTVLPYGKYTYSEIQAPSGYNLNTTIGNINIDSDGKTIQKTIVDTAIQVITRKVVITKENSAGDKLEGAVVEIKNAEGKVFTGTTNSNGEVSFNLPLGNYTYSEVKAPTGYNINTTVGKIDINSAGETIYNVIKDTKITGTVTITKTNNEGTPLADAIIEIKNADGISVFTGKTNDSGEISTKLAYGEYTYQEVKAPNGYNLNPNVYNFNIDKNNQEIKLTIMDSKKPIVIENGKVQITKEDLTTGSPLAGATISIYNAAGDEVYSAITGNDGIISTTLPYGTYTYKEVDAPKGYMINKAVGTFTISKDNKVVKAIIKDSKKPVVIETGKIQITKEDLTTGSPLAGATISIYNSNGEQVYSATTGNDGIISTTLPYGTYTYKEVDAPKGYEISTAVGTFTISKDNEIVKAVIKDKKIPEKPTHPSENTGGSSQNEGNTNNGGVVDNNSGNHGVDNNSGNHGTESNSGHHQEVSNDSSKHPSNNTGHGNNSGNNNAINKPNKHNTSEEVKTLADTGINYNIDGLAASALAILGILAVFFVDKRKF